MTPLIDLAFALLIIFMVTAPLLEQQIRLNLPTESARPQASVPTAFQMISIDAQGHYFWGDRPVSREALGVLLAEMAEVSDPPVLRIRADRGLAYQAVVDLLDAIKQHDLSKVSLDTQVR